MENTRTSVELQQIHCGGDVGRHGPQANAIVIIPCLSALFLILQRCPGNSGTSNLRIYYVVAVTVVVTTLRLRLFKIELVAADGS
ncbi:uncharacterized protein J3R85_018777 [Psidium guajava]|nr:uncharacterized protein J3R85_018777 [Psidium guajava]